MIKDARKPSNDPVQEKLRQEKALWNKETSAFINALINFKKLMNGQPSKFFMQKSQIKNPIPADAATIIGDLADDFQSISQKAKLITEHQLAYSKTRKKKQPKQPKQQMPTEAPTGSIATPPADLTQQLIPGLKASLETQLVVESSNPLTRFLSKFRGPWTGDEQTVRKNKYRKSLLKSAIELDKEIAKLEEEIVRSSAESIFGTGRLLKKIGDRLSFLSGSISSFQSRDTEIVETLQQSSEDKTNEAQIAIQDFLRYETNFPDLSRRLKSDFHDLHAKFLKATPEEKNQTATQMLEAYHALLNTANAKHGTTAANFQTLLDRVQELKSPEVPTPKQASQLVVSGSLITKWLGKIKHKLSPFDKTSALRLDIYKLAGEARSTTDHMMNSLEKDLEPEELQKFMNDIAEKIDAIRNLMIPLMSIIREKMLDPAFMEKLKTQPVLDYGFDVADPMFQKRLQQWRRTEQLRELVGK